MSNYSKPKGAVYIVNYCDAWKMYSSYRLLGVFTNRKKLNVVLNRALKRGDIEWDDTECKDRFVNHLSDGELQTELNYLAVEFIPLNVDNS